ncbi:hypothetical protein EVAR_57430_1 [Eumeta japonica]|uniref:Uncharacterized protein n=1 Tax=Eumeta variegata TaxID=151549 RepID=A0A4C1YBZ4_EUMVA|nr:hypothetical protein EVAR_57430_1 [Eumeta japonica]
MRQVVDCFLEARSNLSKIATAQGGVVGEERELDDCLRTWIVVCSEGLLKGEARPLTRCLLPHGTLRAL